MQKQQRLPWHQSPIDPEYFKSLTQKDDGKALRHVLTHIALIILLGILSYHAFLNLPIYASIPIYFIYTNVLIFIGLCSGLHEMTHGTVFKSKRLQKFFLNFIGFFTWADHVFYKASHTKHHQYTAHHGLEMEVELPMILHVRQYVFALFFNPYFTFSTFIGIVRRALGIIKGEWEEQIFPAENVKLRKKVTRWCRILLIGHLLLASTIIISGQYLLLLYFTFPMASSSIASFAITMTQHTGLQPDVPDSRKCCRSVKVNPIYEFLYWNMNYHIEHHMYAGVPFYNLKKLNKAIEADMPERKSFLDAYKEIIRIQKRQRVEPDYYYIQPCPDAE
jgi:fatty acid desaturase